MVGRISILSRVRAAVAVSSSLYNSSTECAPQAGSSNLATSESVRLLGHCRPVRGRSRCRRHFDHGAGDGPRLTTYRQMEFLQQDLWRASQDRQSQIWRHSPNAQSCHRSSLQCRCSRRMDNPRNTAAGRRLDNVRIGSASSYFACRNPRRLLLLASQAASDSRPGWLRHDRTALRTPDICRRSHRSCRDNVSPRQSQHWRTSRGRCCPAWPGRVLFSG